MMSRRSLLILLCSIPLLLLFRCVAQAYLPLMHQEAYYWMYAQHPSLSYFDHPPMIAWVIGLGTKMFGNTEWGVRSVGSALMIFNGFLMYAFARLFWGRGVAIASAALLLLSPVYFGIGLIATMDSVLLTFWLIGMIGFGLAVLRGKSAGWYLCGVGLGGAMLSKYTGVFLLPGVGLLLLWHRPWRKYLLSPHPYFAAAIGIAMFWPVLVWNWQHDWASFRFQFLSRFDIDGTSHNHPMLEFLGMQIGVATPVVVIGLALLLYRGVGRHRLNGRDKIALAFSIPLLLSIAHKAWGYPAHIDWTVPAYLSLIPAAWQAVFVRVRAKRTWPAFAWRFGPVMPTLAVCGIINVVILTMLMVPKNGSRLFGPWAGIAAEVERREDNLEAASGHEPLVIVDGKYELASLIAFYRNRISAHDNPAVYTTSQIALDEPGVGYAYWFEQHRWIGTDCIFVDDNSDSAADLIGRFKSVKTVWEGTASNGRKYRISECRDYLG